MIRRGDKHVIFHSGRVINLSSRQLRNRFAGGDKPARRLAGQTPDNTAKLAVNDGEPDWRYSLNTGRPRRAASIRLARLCRLLS